jgi:outer membrane protein assembly factor BamA
VSLRTPLSIRASFFLLSVCFFPAFAQKRAVSPAKKPAQSAQSVPDSKQYPITELTTTGSERYDAEDILKASGLKADKSVAVSLDAVKDAAQKLVDSGAFAEINYKHTAALGGMKVEFAVGDKDDDQFIKCDFANIVWLPEKDLLIELHDRVPLFNGTVPRSGTLTSDVAQALQTLLKERGVSANVETEHEDAINGDPATELMTYRVADVEIKIAKIELAGASPEMQTEAENTAKQITGLIYNRATVKRFIDRNLRNVYLKLGYLRATFATPETTVLPDSAGNKTSIAINIPVIEGRIYKAGGLRWTGNRAMLSESLSPYLHLTQGTIVDGVQLAKDVNKLRTHYASLGYLRMTLTPRPSYDDNAGIVNYEMPIKEGDLFSMGKFDVEGVTPASAEKIRLAWQLREGEPFDPAYLSDFFKKFRMPPNTGYLVDEVAGERPNSVDVTVIFCAPNDPCKPKNENHLYTPPASEEDK